MIITKSTPFTAAEIEQLKEIYEVYIKTVIDIKKKICSAGCPLHANSEKILLAQGSNQSDIWGGGMELETKTIDFNAFINIRPLQNNLSNEIQDATIRNQYEALTRDFFHTIL